MANEASPSIIPWSWVIENLARAHEVDVTILRDLIKGIPQLSNSLGKEAREMIALRCMECLFAPVTGFQDDPHSSFRWKDEIDYQDYESLLRCILQENSVTDLMKGASDHIAQDVHYFIEHKRAMLPKTYLEQVRRMYLALAFGYKRGEKWSKCFSSVHLLSLLHPKQLKGTMVKGNHPLVASLYNASGLAVHNQDREETVGANKMGSELKVDGIGADDHAIPAEDNNNSQNSLKRLNGTLISSKKQSSDGSSAENNDEVSADLDIDKRGLLAKKLKQNSDKAAEFVEKHSVAQPSTKDTSEGLLPCADGKVHEVVDEDAPECIQANDTINITSFEKPLVDEADIDGMEDHNKQPEVSSDSEGHCDEENALAARKHQFLSSQGTMSQDSPDSLTEKNLCIKCKTGGELLVCCTASCPLVLHESCLGTFASIDHRAAFYCPFCSYSRAISEYTRAKNKASWARKLLSLFIGGRTAGQSRNHTMKLTGKYREEPGHSGNLKKRHRANHINDMVTPIGNPQSGNSKDRQEHQELEEASALDAGDKMPCRVEDSDAAKVQLHEISEEIGGTNTMVQENRNPGEANGQQNGIQLDHASDSSEPSHEDKATSPVSGAHDESGNEVDVSRPEKVNYSNIADSISIGESDGSAKVEKCPVSTSKYALRCRKQANCYTHSPSAMPQFRRKKVVWTVEEVTALKEGVKKYAGDGVDNKNIPWKAILEHGSSVFQKGRTPIDLKDKWRNIKSRGSPN